MKKLVILAILAIFSVACTKTPNTTEGTVDSTSVDTTSKVVTIFDSVKTFPVDSIPSL
jgi:PBP1b-binding outer membrane lipoprotein LpoB